MNTHLRNPGYKFHFPEKRCKPLDHIAYEMGKNLTWNDEDDYNQAVRYLVGNAITNVHLTTHANRCFKKGSKCYANLPDGVSDTSQLVFNTEFDLWSNWCGVTEERFRFKFQSQRLLEDAFTNVHNRTITKLLMCNNNVQVGMNGRTVLYCTGYQLKSQQKEERLAFEKVSTVLCKVIQKQVCTKRCHINNRQ